MRVSDYPIPDYACYFWHRGDALVIQFPDYGAQRSHSLAIPLDRLSNDAGMPTGVRALLEIMNKRRHDYLAGDKPKIGWDSEPTQQMLEAMMKASYRSPKCTEIEEDIFATEAQVREYDSRRSTTSTEGGDNAIHDSRGEISTASQGAAGHTCDGD